MSRIQLIKNIFIISLLIITIIISSTDIAVIADSSSLFSNRSSILEVGSGKLYHTISEAISNADTGDIIHIYDGVYIENLRIDKSITLHGFSPIDTIIIGMDFGPTILIQADNCVLNNLTITSDINKDIEGIFVSSKGNQIDDCVISKNSNGIVLDNSNNNKISKNNISLNSYYGLFCNHANFNIISNNSFSSNTLSGIKLNSSSSNRIVSNTYNLLDNLTDPDLNLVSHWKMDEPSWSGISGEVQDSEGSNDGIAKNGVTTTENAVVGDYCGYFDGSNDYIEIPNDSSLSILGDLTVSAWIYWEGSTSPDTIICMESYFWILISDDGYLRYKTGASPWDPRVESSQPMPQNKWTHITITRKGSGISSNSVKIYVDHILNNSGDMTHVNGDGIPRNSDSHTYIGKWGYYHSSSDNGDNHFFNGRIDDVRIYSHVLSDMEIMYGSLVQENGILVFNSSLGNFIKMNNFKFNTEMGIHVDGSSSGNHIFHNNFIGNGNNNIQVKDDGNSNIWHNKGEGNYWDNKITPDDDNDGVIDTPLVLEGFAKSKDQYPLTNPFGIISIYGDFNLSTLEDTYFTTKFICRGVEDVIEWLLLSDDSWIEIISPGIFEGTPENEHVGLNYFLFSVSTYNNIKEVVFEIEVLNINDPPDIITDDVDFGIEDKKYDVEYQALDVDPTFDTLTWELNTNAEFLGLLGSRIVGTPGDEDIGTFWVNISVFDNWGGMDTSNFTLNIVNINDPPEIFGTPLLNCMEDSEYNYFPLVSDPDPDDTYNWFLDSDATFLTIDNSNGHLNGLPTNSDVGRFSISISVRDQGELYAYQNYSLNVINVNDPPQIISEFPDIILEDSEVNFKLEAIDIDPTSDILIWSMGTNASFLSLKKSEGLVIGKPINKDVGNYSITFNVSDGKGGYNEVEFIFIVENTNDPPVLGFPPIIIEMREDSVHSEKTLSNWFTDEDGDVLDIQYSTPEHLQITITDQDELIIEPLPDWNGEETISFQASDGEFYLDWDVIIKVLPVNDAPTNLSISIEKTRFCTDEFIVVSGSALDVDLDYGDELTYNWFNRGGTSLGKGKAMEFKFEKGEYELVLNVTDMKGEGAETSIFIEVYEETSTFDAYWIVILIVIVVLILLIVGILIIKRRSNKEIEGDGTGDIAQEDHLSVGNANGYSASIVDGGHLSSPELQSFMKQTDQLPTAPSSDLDGAPVGQLPPVANYQEQTMGGSEYVRPQIDISKKGFHTPPSAGSMVSQASQIEPNSGSEVPPGYSTGGEPPTVSSLIDQMFVGNEPYQPVSQGSNVPALKHASVEPEFNSPIWSPEMVEKRMTNDAKSAVELLHELNELRSEGAITEEEFQIHKKRLLRKI